MGKGSIGVAVVVAVAVVVTAVVTVGGGVIGVR